VGEELSYSIVIDHEEPSDVSVRAPQFDGLRLIDGPSIRPVTQFASGVSRRAVEVSFSFIATVPGRFVLPAIPVSVAGQSYLTERHLLEIGSTRDRDQVPFRARWSGPTGPLFVGQSVVYSLEIYNVEEFLYPDSVVIGQAQRAIMEEVQGLGDISRIVVEGFDLYTIPVAVFMVTATESGSLELPPVTIGSSPISVSVPSRAVTVNPLPEAVASTGAVGDLSYSVEASDLSASIGQTLSITQRVTGTGNLHFLSIPELDVSGFQIADEQTRSQLIARENGYSGQVEWVTTLRALSEGPYRITAPPFVSLNPVNRRVERSSSPVLNPQISELRQPNVGTDGVESLEPLEPARMQSIDRRVWFDSPFSYGWFIPGVLFFVASRFWKKPPTLLLIALVGFVLTDALPDSQIYDRADEALRLYESGEVEAAVISLEQVHRSMAASPSLEYNLSVLYFQLGDIPRSVYAAREAVRLAPRRSLPRELLATVEASAGIDRAIAPRHVVHPDVPFAALAISVNSFFVLAAFAARRKRPALLVGQLVIGIVMIVSLAGLIFVAVVHGEQLAIVTTDYDLRRIPSDDSEGWLIVKEGTAVEIVASQDRFVLVRTAFGLEGWVESDGLLWSESPTFFEARYRSTRPDET
jgi:hypothetical protein